MPPKERLDKLLQFWVTTAQQEALREEAAANGMSLSALIRTKMGYELPRLTVAEVRGILDELVRTEVRAELDRARDGELQ